MAPRFKTTKLVVDARMITRKNTHGIARYTLEWLKYLAQNPSPYLVPVMLTAPDFPQEQFTCSTAIAQVQTSIPWISLQEQLLLPLLLKKIGCQLFHSPSFMSLMWTPCPLVMTIHDLNHVHLPHHYGMAQKWYYRLLVARAISRAQLIFTVSKFSQTELERIYPASKGKIVVTGNGVAECFRLETNAPATLAPHLAHTGPYFVAIASDKAHKNLEWIVQAVEIMHDHDPQLKVIVCGTRPEQLCKQIDEKRLRSRFIFTGPLNDHELAYVLRHAKALLFPSIYEGFGLPVLEALACGTAVVCAQATSLPEVAGEHAFYFEPTRFESFYSAMHTAWKAHDSTALKQARSTHAHTFCWDAFGQQTKSALESRCLFLAHSPSVAATSNT
ncbi:MAG: glycosyltransferase family 1 protein [Zetaproteobacteria bacterium]|nr:glycosyltransferase family 1 protein [Zetaproteobacteria bacterium]